jgi:lipopolysaccharide transport system permease protein
VPARLVAMNTLSNFITYLFALPILCVVLAIYGFPFTPALLALPVLLLIQGVLINGLSLIFATLNVLYRDVQHIVNVGLTLLFYLTPIFYRTQAVVEQYQALYELSPIAVLIQSYRAVFFYGVAPSWPSLAFAAVCSLAVYSLGYGIFRLYQHEIIDVL